MTPLETLQKYGLKTDVPSIKERLTVRDYYTAIHWSERFMELPLEPYETFDEVVDALESADLALLCSLAKKGERYEKAVKSHLQYWQSLLERYEKDNKPSLAYGTVFEQMQCNDRVSAILEIITEAEGE